MGYQEVTILSKFTEVLPISQPIPILTDANRR